MYGLRARHMPGETMNSSFSTVILSGRNRSPFKFSSATVCAAVPSRAYRDDGRSMPAVLVMLAGHASHMLAEDGEQAACLAIEPLLGQPQRFARCCQLQEVPDQQEALHRGGLGLGLADGDGAVADVVHQDRVGGVDEVAQCFDQHVVGIFTWHCSS